MGHRLGQLHQPRRDRVGDRRSFEGRKGLGDVCDDECLDPFDGAAVKDGALQHFDLGLRQ